MGHVRDTRICRRRCGPAIGLAAALLAVAVAEPAAAAPDADSPTTEELAEMPIEGLLDVEVDVGSLEGSTAFQTPSTVTVIDRDMIETFGFRTVAEALETVAGYATVRTYSVRTVPSIRGLLNFHYANKILLMIDGVPTWSATTGNTNLERISIEAVERIEILKGPASVLYGTNAYSGAINIVLTDTAREGAAAYGRLGLNGAYGAGATTALAWRGLELTMAAEAFDDGDADPFRFVGEDGVGALVIDYARGGNVTATVRYGGHRLLFNRFVYEYMRFGTSPTFADGAGHDQLHSGALAEYRYRHRFGDRVTAQAAVGWDQNSRNFSRSPDDTLRTNDSGWRLSATSDAAIEAWGGLYFDAGGAIDYRYSEEYRNYSAREGTTQSDNGMRGVSVAEGSLFTQAGYRSDRFNLVAGARLTQNELFGLNLALRSTVVYTLARSHTLKLVLGQSYRAPSLFEIYFASTEGTVLGNRDLAPETSDSVELVYLAEIHGLVAQATAFYADHSDIIYRALREVTLPDGTVGQANVYDNGDVLRSAGIEAELRYHVDHCIDLFASAAYLADLTPDDSAAARDYDVLRFHPSLWGSAGGARHLGPFTAAAIVHYRSSTNGPVEEIAQSATIDASLAYRLHLAGRQSELRLYGQDLTDARVEYPEYVRRRTVNAIRRDGYGRTFLLALRWEL